MIEAKAPGKLYLAGEYAVVEPGHPAVIVAVNQWLVAQITKEKTGRITSTQRPDVTLSWKRQDTQIKVDVVDTYPLIVSCMQVVEDYIRSLGLLVDSYYHIAIQSDLDEKESGIKYGLGSSGAITVAVVKVLLAYYQQESPPLLVYKLAVLAQLQMGMTGSFGDVASSSFQGMIAYYSVDRKWLLEQSTLLSISELVNQDWKDLAIVPLDLPEPLEILVGWTGVAASTEQLVTQVHQQLTQAEKKHYHQQFLKENQDCVERLIQACKDTHFELVKQAIRTNRQQLQAFSSAMEIVIETPQLTQLCQLAEQHGAVAKSSGAGGGDCGICLVESQKQKQAICHDWQNSGIVPLPLSIAHSK